MTNIRQAAEALDAEIDNGVVRLTRDERIACYEHWLKAQRAEVWGEIRSYIENHLDFGVDMSFARKH